MNALKQGLMFHEDRLRRILEARRNGYIWTEEDDQRLYGDHPELGRNHLNLSHPMILQRFRDEIMKLEKQNIQLNMYKNMVLARDYGMTDKGVLQYDDP